MEAHEILTNNDFLTKDLCWSVQKWRREVGEKNTRMTITKIFTQHANTNY